MGQYADQRAHDVAWMTAAEREAHGRYASHVVVDLHDGYTFWNGSDGELFTAATAAAFAAGRNSEMKPEHRAYRVFALVAV
jgi:hypothetical protein